MTRRSTATVALAAALAVSGGCKKDKENLVLVSLVTAYSVSGLSSAKITIGGKSKTYPLSQLSQTPTVLGFYVPDDAGTHVQVSVGVQAGASCDGLAGSGAANIGDDGTGTAQIQLVNGNACSDPQPPSLLNCREYDHVASGTACDPNYPVFVRSVAFSRNGDYFATGGSDSRVKIWTFDGRGLQAQGKEIIKDGLNHVAFSPDGALLAVGTIADAVQPVDLYEVGSWKKRRSLTATTGYVAGLAFSPDSQHVIALEWDGDVAGDLLALPIDGGAATDTVAIPFTPWWVAVGETETDGAVAVAVASSSDDRVALLSFNGRRFSEPTFFSVTNDPSLNPWAIGISPDGRFLAAGGDDNQFRFWNVPFQSATPVSDPFIVYESLTTLVFSPSGDYVAVASGAGDSGTLSVWDRLTQTLRGYYYPTHAPYGIAYAPSGTAIAGGEDGCGKVFVCAD